MSSCWRKTDRKYNRVVYADDAVDLSGSLDDVNTQLIQPSQPRRVTAPNDPDEMFRRTTDERKYKYSLVSVLIMGVFLIMMVNLGLGYRNCGRDDEEKHTHYVPHPVKKEYCMDKTTGLLFPWQNYRLPGSVSPQQYDIFIHPNLTERTYSGRVKVIVEVMEATSTIIMHSDKNNITSATILLLSDETTSTPLKPVKQFECDTNNMIALQFEHPLTVGSSYELEIEFESTLHYGLDGLYLSKYTDEAAKQHVIATTQFESVAARAAFPCFDEPAFKANFTLSVVRDDKQLVLFNTPLKESKVFEGDGVSKLDVFEPTVKMSSYLVAFVISEFKSTTCHTTSGIEVSVYSQPDKVGDTMYAANFSCQVLDYYEKLFKIPYPLPKLDLVAIPDFAAGAMENWGLVTYRQTALLYNPKTSSLQDKQWVGKVIAHELAHQWFGNLVTMEWWDDLWLNEGFASYMEYKGMDSVEKEWNVMSDFLLDHTSSAMDADSYINTHKISMKTTNSLEIAQLFDTITYDKGACIIYMLIDWLGNDDFFNGITAYLNKYAYSNAENGDLIHYLAEASPAAKKDKVAKMMETWTSQPGLPIVHVSKSSSNQSKILLKQTRFTFPTGKSDGEDTDELWDIPVSYVTSHNHSKLHRYFISGKTTEVDVGSTFDWIKLNHNQAGYYRVNYDSELWDGLLSQMKTDHQIFSPSDRVGLISDAFISAYAGLMKYDRLMEMSKYLVNEDKYAPLSTAVSELATIDKLLRFHKSGSGASNMMRSYIKSLLSSQFDRLAWKTTNELSLEDVKLQQAVVQTVCLMGHKPCVKEASRLLEDWLVNATAIPSNWISLVFNTALKHGSKSTWERAWQAYLKETDPNVKSKILSGLSLTTDGDKVMFLHHKLDDDNDDDIKSQDHAKVLVYTSSSLSGSTLAWNFVKNSWSKLVEIHGSTSFAMRSIISGCLRSLIQEKEISAADKFFQDQKISQLSFIKKSLESARVRINWAANNAAAVDSWLRDNPIHNEL